MAVRKPRIEYYWSTQIVDVNAEVSETRHVINWHLVGANGEVMCQSTQGSRDKTDAIRSTTAVAGMFNGDVDAIKHVGPGKKPNA